jgi:hypothetical protein
MYGSPETTRPSNWRELFFMKGEVPPCLVTDSMELIGAKLGFWNRNFRIIAYQN